jgi:hypothetical protein
MDQRTISLPVGVVVRRQPGVTRWAKWIWRPVAAIPGAPPASWTELLREGDAVDYHAATVTLELHRADAEAYLVSLSMRPPKVFVVLRRAVGATEYPWSVHAVTASAYEAQDYEDNGEDLVAPVPMTRGLRALIADFSWEHYASHGFVKRRRDEVSTDRSEDGIGDPRIRQASDIYRAPGRTKPREPHR